MTYRPRGTQEKKTIIVRRVISCTGPQSDYRKLDDPLVHRLLERDLLAPDPLRIGANTDQDGRLLNQAGEPIHRLYTLGSPRSDRRQSRTKPKSRGRGTTSVAAISKNPRRGPSILVHHRQKGSAPSFANSRDSHTKQGGRRLPQDGLEKIRAAAPYAPSLR